MKQKIKRGKRRKKGRQVNQVELTCCPTVGGKVIRKRITHESTRDVYAHITVFIIDAPMRTHVRTHTYSLTFILTPTHSDVYLLTFILRFAHAPHHSLVLTVMLFK